MNGIYVEHAFVEYEKDLKTLEVLQEVWRDEKNRIHRSQGLPAVVRYQPGTGQTVFLQYMSHGLLNRVDGPARLRIDPETKVVVEEEWFRNSERHRWDGPALIVRDRSSGEVLQSEFHRSRKSIYWPENLPTPT